MEWPQEHGAESSKPDIKECMFGFIYTKLEKKTSM